MPAVTARAQASRDSVPVVLGHMLIGRRRELRARLGTLRPHLICSPRPSCRWRTFCDSRFPAGRSRGVRSHPDTEQGRSTLSKGIVKLSMSTLMVLVTAQNGGQTARIYLIVVGATDWNLCSFRNSNEICKGSIMSRQMSTNGMVRLCSCPASDKLARAHRPGATHACANTNCDYRSRNRYRQELVPHRWAR